MAKEHSKRGQHTSFYSVDSDFLDYIINIKRGEKMKYLSLFSGIGGFELGIHNALAKSRILGNGDNRELPNNNSELLQGTMQSATPICIGYSEIDPYADAIYKYNFGGHKNYGDCTKINPKELPDFDLLVGGFPCQAFSIAGKRRGFDDTRGTLIFDVLRILKEKQPRHFILENVKGLLSHDAGRTFKVIIASLTELGYGVEWQVLNAKNFGVPQNRERVFIVGHLGGFGGRQIFPIRPADGETTDDSRVQQTANPREISRTILARDYKDPKCVAFHNNRTTATITNNCNSLTSSFRGHPDGDGRPAVYKNARIRRLTPTECERLMGYPDDWTKYGLYGDCITGESGECPACTEVKEMSDTRRYKACGNGVVSNVVEEVARRLCWL